MKTLEMEPVLTESPPVVTSPAMGAAAAPAPVKSFYMDPEQRQFGAWRLDDAALTSAVRFSLFFPDRRKDATQYEDRPEAAGGHYGDPQIRSIRVIGDFQSQLGQVDWDEKTAPCLIPVAHPKGVVWTFDTPKKLDAGVYQYKYYIEFENGEHRRVSDPCSRYGGKEPKYQNSAFVVGPKEIGTVEPLAHRKELRDLVMYELNIDDFTDEFRFTAEPGQRSALEAVVTKLDYLQKLGINAILFLPWTAWANDQYSWGYTPYQYFSVEHRYTNDETDTEHETKQLSRLRYLITECHRRGIHVIMDGVFNHVGPDTDPNYSGFPYRWMYQDPEACPYTGIFGGTFGDLRDLDYNNGCTRQFIRDVCFYWMDEFKIDGIRFDNTVNFYIPGIRNGLPSLLEDIEAHVPGSRFSLTIEHMNESAATVTNATKATSYWNDGMRQEVFGAMWTGKIEPRLLRILDNHLGLNGGKVATSYLSQHDYSHVTWAAGAVEGCGSMNWFRTQPGAITLFTSPGAPMIQNGQEFGEDHWIPGDDHGTNRRVKPRPLRWGYADDHIGKSLLDLYRKLIALRRGYPALRSDNFYPPAWEDWQKQFNPAGYGIDVEKQLLIYHRWGEDERERVQRFIVVVNFSCHDQYVDVPFSNNEPWKDLLNQGIMVVPWDFKVRNWKVNSYWGNIFFQ